MSSSPPNSFSGAKVLWLAVPAVIAVVLLVLAGQWAVQSPVTTAATAAPEPAAAPQPEPAKMAAFTLDQKQQIEKIIKDYLITNPEIFIEVQTALEEKMEKEQAEKLKVAIAENAAEIYREPDAAVAGNPDGDITVVEFFDYNCGYCKRGLGDIVKLVESDPNVRVVFKELPILSKGSEEAARVALAAKKQGKYWEVHRALLQARGHMNEAAALRLAEKGQVLVLSNGGGEHEGRAPDPRPGRDGPADHVHGTRHAGSAAGSHAASCH